MIKHPRILYFIGAPVATPEEAADARRFGTNVAFRNAGLVDETAGVEKCDGVAGKVPAVYAKQFPDAVAIIADFNTKNPPFVPAAPTVTPAAPAPVVPPVVPVAPPAPPPAAPAAPAAPVVPVVPGAGWGQPPQQ